jgi:rhodanese-related sulfurtransferase
MPLACPINWTVNRALAAVALVLGALALFGNPFGGSTVTIDTEELAWIVDNEVDHVTVYELADRIITGATDYRLIDLRDPHEYADYHIPSAENVSIAELPSYPLLRNEQIILYSGGGIHSAQAWFLLKAKRYPSAYMLLGGLDAWTDYVLYPELPENPSVEEQAEFEKRAEVAAFFGGSPRSPQSQDVTAQAPPLPSPDLSAQPVIVRKKKSMKEGC